jgi:putative transposase
LAVAERRALVAPTHAVALCRQCELVGLARSSYYYEPAPTSDEQLALLRLVDELFTEQPTYGQRRLQVVLARDHGVVVGRKRLRGVLQTLGLAAVCPRPCTSKPIGTHRRFPYLLRGVVVATPGAVWATDITYVRLERGFVYLVAHMDWHSRYVLSWRVSTTMDVGFCLESLDEALSRHPHPDIHNSDQGAQFAADAYIERLLAERIAVSMDGRGRWADNVFVERLWRTVKYECLFLREHASPREVGMSLRAFFEHYNERRPHSSLGYATPGAVFRGEVRVEPKQPKVSTSTPQERTRAAPRDAPTSPPALVPNGG